MTFKALRRRTLTTVAAAAIAAATLGAIPAHGATTPAGDGKFHVVGANIIGPDGKIFIPRGVNIAGLDNNAYAVIKQDQFTLAKAWGANMIRLPLSSTFWLPEMCTDVASYPARVDQMVQWATSLKMLILLDNHRATNGTACAFKGLNGNQNKMADTYARGFLEALAHRYKGNPYVAFDLFNEPHDISDDVWRNGGRVDMYRAYGMQDLIDTVRGEGSTNLVFVSGNAWANDLRMIVNNPLIGENIVYAAHSYPYWCNGKKVSNSIPYKCNGKQYPPFLEFSVAPAIGKRAVVITEFGTPRSIAGEMSAPIAWFEARKIGWSAYNFANATTQTFGLLEKNSNNPSVTGLPVKNGLAKNLV